MFKERRFNALPALWPHGITSLANDIPGRTMSSEDLIEHKKTALHARQFLLLAIVMNLLALITAIADDFGMLPGMLLAVGILGGAAGISFIRKSMEFSLFVMAVFWLIVCTPILNLALLIPLYRNAASTYASLKEDRQREETLVRARERSNAPAVPAAPAEAKPAADEAKPKSDFIEFTPSLPAKAHK